METKERIIKTVAYFDLFDYPLSRAEIRGWLYGDRKVSFSETEEAIDALIADGTLKENGGFVSAADREGLNDIRRERFMHSLRKKKRSRRWARIFGSLPGVELVGIANTLAYDNARDGSDIDFFIVSAPGTVWRTRLLAAGLAALCGLRPKAGDSRDRLCLSFFVTSDSLDLAAAIADSRGFIGTERSRVLAAKAPARSGLNLSAREKGGENDFEDIYLHYWLRQMLPLCGYESAAEKYRQANGLDRKRGVPLVPGSLARLVGFLRHLPGDFLKAAQISHFPPAINESWARHDGSVVISDNILKFHVNDRRREVYDKWTRRCGSLMPECRKAPQEAAV